MNQQETNERKATALETVASAAEEVAAAFRLCAEKLRKENEAVEQLGQILGETGYAPEAN